MSSKSQKLEFQRHTKTSIYMDVNILPNEVWYIIFSHLDERSIRCVSETCKLWFELIRSNVNTSSQICLVNDNLKKFQIKLAKSEWIWERWPVLRTLEFGRSHMICEHVVNEPPFAFEAMNIVKSINFKQCETLDKVVFSVNFDPAIPYSSQNLMKKYCMVAHMEKLTFNPHIEIKSFGMEHILNLHISLNMDINANRTCEGLHFIGEKAKSLQKLTISLERTKSVCNTGEGLALVISSFSRMFVGLNDSLETIEFCNTEDNYDLDFDILKLLSEKCENLTKVVVGLRNCSFLIRFGSIGYFKNLKDLAVPRLCYIDGFDQNYDTVTDLCVENADMKILKDYNLKRMCQNFKKLEKCTLNVRVNLITDWLHCSDWQKIVDETFQESTEVKFLFKMRQYQFKTVTKLPYQKSIFDQNMKWNSGNVFNTPVL